MNQPDRRIDLAGDFQRRLRLEACFAEARTIILDRQDPITGLLPASTAITVHGDYTHAWVRDNVYSILGVWGLALAYRRLDEGARTYLLEQSVVKLMRGLLTTMMRQAAKVERFKQTQQPGDALHAKYDTRTGLPVVGDQEWGHLQLDATSLFLLMLAQMTASGLRIVYTLDEVDFVQNLVHYIDRTYHTPDFGIWERGSKINNGRPEINASSVGMAKAALEALRGFNLFGPRGGDSSVIHVIQDEIARATTTLETLLPRESGSKEVDAAVLSIVGFPAFAVQDADLADRTREEIVAKLQGRYGCKRFLRDGHQTVLEDHSRLHYESGELSEFEHIECEWPLFFTYLLLDGVMRGRPGQAREYRERLEALFVTRDGQRLLPELYYVPAEHVAAERARPHSQPRLPNDNVPLVWAQSLYLLGVLLHEGFIHPSDVDPLGRRHRIGAPRDTRVQMVLLSEDRQVEARLRSHGIISQSLDQIEPVQLRPAEDLARAFCGLGDNPALALSGRPPRRLGSLVTSQVFTLGTDTLVFLPPFLSQGSSYLNLDNRLLVRRLKAELAYISRHWEGPGRPLLALLVTTPMLQAGGRRVLLDLMRELQTGTCAGVRVRVGNLAEFLPTSGHARLDHLDCAALGSPGLAPDAGPSSLLPVEPRACRPLGAAHSAALQRAEDEQRLLARLQASPNVYEQAEILGVLWARLGPEHVVEGSASLRTLAETVYAEAARGRHWGALRRAAALLGRYDESLEDAVGDIVTRQVRLVVGRAYSPEAVIAQPLTHDEIVQRIEVAWEDDSRTRILVQEIILGLAMLGKAEPVLLEGALTLRVWHLLLLLNTRLARELALPKGAAFDALLDASPDELLGRLRELLASDEDPRRRLARLETLQRGDDCPDLIPVRFSASDDPPLTQKDWRAWRELNGVLTRLSPDFHSGVWAMLRQCRGLVIGDQLSDANRLDSVTLLSDTTPSEKNFALMVEDLLNDIQAPEYRQLCIEALEALTRVLEANPGLRVEDDLVLDVLIGHAVHLAYRDVPAGAGQSEDADPRTPWEAFYASPPHRVARFVHRAFESLLGEARSRLEVAS